MTDSGAWSVLVEENTGAGNTARWSLNFFEHVGAVEAARQRAAQVAASYRAKKPARLQRRSVFRAEDGSYLVHLEGATTLWHFRVRIAEFVATFDGDGNQLA